MKSAKYLIISFVIALIIPAFVSAATTSEIQTQIQTLMQQLKALQEQLAAMQPTTAVWCHDFNANIGINNSGSEVESLQTALGKEGFDIGEDEKGNFGENTASAVSGLQQKYVDEILAPLKLKYGTGYLGKATRTKLNKLYGCGIKPSPTITPIPTCNVFLTCETGYTSYNTGEKDNQSCPIIKCISNPIPVPIPSISIPIISEQVKCLFHESKSMQECYSSAGVSCKDISVCVADVKGVKGEQITWKSSCGGYAYTTMDGNNEYAEFKCAASAIPTTTTTPIPTTPQTPTISPTTPITPPTTPSITVLPSTGNQLTALSAEIIGGQSTYTPGQKIKFSVKGMASDGSIAVPAKGFNVQAWMQKTNPIETVKIGYMYQSFNADYDWNAGLWIVTMTVPSDDTLQIYKIEAALYCSDSSLGCSRPGQINKSFTFSIVTAGTPTTPVPTTPKSVIPPSAVGTSTRKFKPIDPSRCPGIIETSCTIEPANIIKVSVYDEKGGFIDTRENNNSGMAGFLDLPYGNYTVVINAEGFEYYKASFTVCATCEAITTIYLKKTSTVSQNHSPDITGGSALPPTTIQAGQTVNFSWNAADMDKDNLFWSVNWGDGIGMATVCPASNPSNGQGGTLNTYHAWEQAGTYMVKVTVSDCKGSTDSSTVMVNIAAAIPSITVTPSITVLSPNGGEKWQAGNYYEVKWRNTTGWSVKIEIIKGDSLVSSWSPIDSTVSTYSVGLPLPLEAGSDYKIRITTIDTGIVDSSDAAFSIVAGSTSQAGNNQTANVLEAIQEALNKITEAIKQLR